MEAVFNEISDYERDPQRRTGGNPMPTLIHGAIQANVSFELKLNYRTQFRVASEVLLDTQPTGSTPDIILYPLTALDYKNDIPRAVRMLHY